MAKDWPEYAYWYEDGELKYDSFEDMSAYGDKYPNGFPVNNIIGYRPEYQWRSPWMEIVGDHANAIPLPPEQVPVEIRALHLLIS